MIQSLYHHRKVILVNAATCLFLALFLETVAYVGLANPALIPGFLLPHFRRYYQEADRQIIQVSSCGQYNSQLFYTLRPGTCEFTNREFTVSNAINSKGLRDDESSLNDPGIIVLGDSWTMGWGVEQDLSFPQQLEKLSGQKVLNAGISSFGTAREFLLFESLPSQNAPVVVIQYHENDYAENKQYIDNNFILPIRSQYSYDSLAKAIQKRQRYFLFKHLYGITKSVGQSMLGQGKEHEKKPSPAAQAEVFLQVIKRHEDTLKGKKIIVLQAVDINNLGNDFVDAVDSLKRKEQFEELNITTVRISDVLKEDDYYVLDDHINHSGHLKIARAIHNIVSDYNQISTP